MESTHGAALANHLDRRGRQEMVLHQSGGDRNPVLGFGQGHRLGGTSHRGRSGMGVESLGRAICADIQQASSDISYEEAVVWAEEIYRWHRDTFRGNWTFPAGIRADGPVAALLPRHGWLDVLLRQADRIQPVAELPDPDQCRHDAAGRRSSCWLRTDFEVTKTLHHAVYVYCPE